MNVINCAMSLLVGLGHKRVSYCCNLYNDGNKCQKLVRMFGQLLKSSDPFLLKLRAFLTIHY